MIIVLKPNTSKENVARVEELIKRKGLDTHVVNGAEMTVIGCIGDTTRVDPKIFEVDSSVDKVKMCIRDSINNDANWLLHMVENLLSVTRIQDNQQTVHKEPELVEEVVAEATQRLKKRLPDARIIVHAPEDMILLPMDALLIEQVLINLLENAILDVYKRQVRYGWISDLPR